MLNKLTTYPAERFVKNPCFPGKAAGSAPQDGPFPRAGMNIRHRSQKQILRSVTRRSDAIRAASLWSGNGIQHPGMLQVDERSTVAFDSTHGGLISDDAHADMSAACGGTASSIRVTVLVTGSKIAKYPWPLAAPDSRNRPLNPTKRRYSTSGGNDWVTSVKAFVAGLNSIIMGAPVLPLNPRTSRSRRLNPAPNMAPTSPGTVGFRSRKAPLKVIHPSAGDVGDPGRDGPAPISNVSSPHRMALLVAK